MTENGGNTRVLVSYLTLRRVIGLLGVSLPFVLAFGGIVLSTRPEWLQNSISDYYGTEMRNVLVGVLFAIGFFLFSYRGHEPRDNVAGDLACLFALGTALFPTTSDHSVVRAVHFVSAGALFLTLSYFSLRLFTKTEEGGTPTAEKLFRNKIYVGCGVVMLMCIAAIVIYYAFLRESSLSAIKPVFWLEAFALWAFGASWFVKGETLWQDATGDH